MGRFSVSFRCFFIMTGTTLNPHFKLNGFIPSSHAETSVSASKTWNRCVLLNRQMLKTTLLLESERVSFAVGWINSPGSAGRGSYCMYSHTSAFDHLSPPLWLTYLLSFPLNTKKIRIEDEAGRRGRLLGLLRCTPLLPEVSNSTCFCLFGLLFQVGSVSLHAALLRFSSRFHFIVRS